MSPPSRTLTAPASPANEEENRRHNVRVEYHTAVTVIADGDDGFYCIRSRSSNLSATGARIVCQEPLPVRTVYLRILMPELAERFVEAQVVNEHVKEVSRLGRTAELQYVYGLKFVRFVSEQGILDRLRIVAASRSPSPAQIDSAATGRD